MHFHFNFEHQFLRYCVHVPFQHTLVCVIQL